MNGAGRPAAGSGPDARSHRVVLHYAVGISTVVVNGEVVVDGGDHTGALPGRVLRRPISHIP